MTNKEFWESKLMRGCTIVRSTKSGMIKYSRLGDGRIYRVQTRYNARQTNVSEYITMREAIEQICRHHYDCRFSY